MPRVLLAVASIALSVYALADCVGTEDARVRGIPRWAWIVLIVLVPWVGPLTWLLAGKDREVPGTPAGRPREAARPGDPAPRPARGSRPRSLAPDDDPEFLRELGERIRREKRERERRDRQDDSADGTEDTEGTDEDRRGRGGAGA